jgi:cell division protein FtsB
MNADPQKTESKKTKKTKSVYRSLFERLMMLPLITLALSVAGLYSVDRWVLKPIERQQQHLLSIQQQVNQLNRQIQHYQQYAVEFDSDTALKLIEPLDEIRWIDELSLYAQKNNLNPLNISFGAEQKLTKGQTLRLVQQQEVFYQTPITLEAGLYHEGDFIRLMDRLYQLNEYL